MVPRTIATSIIDYSSMAGDGSLISHYLSFLRIGIGGTIITVLEGAPSFSRRVGLPGCLPLFVLCLLVTSNFHVYLAYRWDTSPVLCRQLPYLLRDDLADGCPQLLHIEVDEFVVGEDISA